MNSENAVTDDVVHCLGQPVLVTLIELKQLARTITVAIRSTYNSTQMCKISNQYDRNRTGSVGAKSCIVIGHMSDACAETGQMSFLPQW